MHPHFHRVCAPIILAVALLAAGCSEIEPKNGTRVTFALPSGGAVSREKTAELSRYLVLRGVGVLDVEKPRVESVDGSRLVLLLPGRKVPKENVAKLLERTSLEFYHLKNVATKTHPDRPWQLRLPKAKGAPYVFAGPDSTRIDSHAHPDALLADVIGGPAEEPILTGADVLPQASHRQVASGWAVLVRFTEDGARRFFEFTRKNRGEYLAVFYNGSLISAAMVEDPIDGGEAFLTGFWTLPDATAAVNQLNAGVLPVEVEIRSVKYY